MRKFVAALAAGGSRRHANKGGEKVMLESPRHELLEQTVHTNAQPCLGLDANGEISACNSPALHLLRAGRQDVDHGNRVER